MSKSNIRGAATGRWSGGRTAGPNFPREAGVDIETGTGIMTFGLTITCDSCGFRESFAGPSTEELEEKIAAHNWKRFGPSGSDLCWQCKGASPNTIIQVKR
jgi:hypothetical protein